MKLLISVGIEIRGIQGIRTPVLSSIAGNTGADVYRAIENLDNKIVLVEKDSLACV